MWTSIGNYDESDLPRAHDAGHVRDFPRSRHLRGDPGLVCLFLPRDTQAEYVAPAVIYAVPTPVPRYVIPSLPGHWLRVRLHLQRCCPRRTVRCPRAGKFFSAEWS